MRLDGVLADAEGRRNLLVGSAGSEPAEDGKLTRRQALGSGAAAMDAAGQFRRRCGREVGAAGRDDLDRLV